MEKLTRNQVSALIFGLAFGIPLLAIIFILPTWFLGNDTYLPVELVTASLTIDGIMVAVTAFFTPLKSNPDDRFLGRNVLVISMEFVASVVFFLLSLHGFFESPLGLAVPVGNLIRVGLISMFAGLASLFVLMIGTFLTYASQE